MRLLRKRLLASVGDHALSAPALDFDPELRAHQQNLVRILTDTIDGGQNNSILLVGPRGSGKTLVMDSALRQLQATHGERVFAVRLSGLLHAEYSTGIREIAEQLCSAAVFEELEFNRAAGFGENMSLMREVLRKLEGGRRSVVFVLEEFDMFTQKGQNSRQSLLYSVMDLLQQKQVQAAVVGVTCRHDAAELLEKRVASRFSSRRILLAPPVGRMRAQVLLRTALALPLPPPLLLPPPPLLPPPLPSTNGSRLSPPPAAARNHVDNRDGAERVVVFPPEPGYAARFNAALDAAIAVRAVPLALKAYESLDCNPRAIGDLALVALCRMDRDVGVITSGNIIDAVRTLREEPYITSLASGSVLELLLVVAMERLHTFRQMPSFNFNHVENELGAMAANDFLGDAGRAKAPVLLRAFEGLLDMGLVEARLDGGGGGSGRRGAFGVGAGGPGRGRGGSGSGRKQFRQIKLLLTGEEVRIAVLKNNSRPAGLEELLKHEGVRQATSI